MAKWKKMQWLMVLGFTAMVIFLGACSKGPTAEETFQTYADVWEKQDFAEMYAWLSQETKANVTEAEFVERHENIYNGIEASNLHIKPDIPDEIEADEGGSVTIPFSLTMDTMAGTIEFTHQATLVEEETEDETTWAVVWDEQMIFPQLEPGDKVRAETKRAKRGEITDRNGSGLAVNGTVASIGVVPSKLAENEAESKERLAEELGISVGFIDEKLSASWVQPDYFVPIASLPQDEVERINQLLDIPGVSKQDVPARVYPYGEAAAHLTGYVQEINADELAEREDEGYRAGDMLGKSGLEQVYEERLRGQDGGIVYITDEAGETKEVLAEKAPQDGENIQLTIDMVLQEALYNELKGDAGTATALHPISGEVLSLVNSPAYDPNQFVLGLSEEQWNDWNEDPDKPLLNRFAQTYAPGSAFKPVTAAIGLETGAITPDEQFDISGKTWRADESWGDYTVTRVSDPGSPVDLQKAFIYSDNIYFAQAALAISEETFSSEAERFGIGESMPFAYPIKTSQLAGEDGIKNDIQLADSGYGQGEVAMSALHLALSFTPFVNEGNLIKPQLERQTESSPEVWHEQVMTADTARLILDNLIQVVEHPNGTGRAANIPGTTLAAKTGTAELKQSKDDTDGKENGWFVALDTDEPELLIAMMIEDVKDRGGSNYVVPKVKRVLQDFVVEQ